MDSCHGSLKAGFNPLFQNSNLLQRGMPVLQANLGELLGDRLFSVPMC
jgi:hypothetical protein